MPRIDEHDPNNAELTIKLDVSMAELAAFLRAWEEYRDSLIEIAGPITQATLAFPKPLPAMELDYF